MTLVAGFFAGAVVALHPLGVEVVPAVARNIDSLLSVWVLTALLAARSGRFWLTFAACVFAMCTKETAVALLPVIVGWWWDGWAGDGEGRGELCWAGLGWAGAGPGRAGPGWAGPGPNWARKGAQTNGIITYGPQWDNNRPQGTPI